MFITQATVEWLNDRIIAVSTKGFHVFLSKDLKPKDILLNDIRPQTMFVQSSYVSHHFDNRKWVYNFWRFVDQVALDQVAFDQKGRRRQNISRCIFEFNFNGSQIQEVK
jgi:hypothetical protein